MQTFLPDPDFYISLSCLDPKRLGNQIYREAFILANGGWKHHPAYKMWKNHIYSLCEYALIGLQVLKERGRFYPHHIEKFTSIQQLHENTGIPYWIGQKDFHDSHKSNLLRKDFAWYSKFGWDVPNNLPYIWPI